ncbi:MAG: hypothetical protein RJB38_1749 [Pseudomonadota bacterium]|jgi:hypothetical protein
MTLTRMTAEHMKRALAQLDELLEKPVTLIMGGGGAMILAHGFPLATTDIDAVPKGIEIAELDVLVKKIALEQQLAPDWLNPYFSTFAHTLPLDYGERLVDVFSGRHLRVRALGKDEMLLMKCFAHRQKDVGHAKSLIKKGADLDRVQTRIEELLKKKIPGSREALDFLDDVLDQCEGS